MFSASLALLSFGEFSTSLASFTSEWNLDPDLHEYELVFHSVSTVRSGMKNEVETQTWVSCRIHVTKKKTQTHTGNGISSIRIATRSGCN